jgi:hypothetical protein
LRAQRVEQGGLQAREREIERIGAEQRARQGDGVRVAAERRLLDRRAARVGQAQQRRTLVERFAGGIVARRAEPFGLAGPCTR